jgi:hypothetical protein
VRSSVDSASQQFKGLEHPPKQTKTLPRVRTSHNGTLAELHHSRRAQGSTARLETHDVCAPCEVSHTHSHRQATARPPQIAARATRQHTRSTHRRARHKTQLLRHSPARRTLAQATTQTRLRGPVPRKRRGLLRARRHSHAPRKRPRVFRHAPPSRASLRADPRRRALCAPAKTAQPPRPRARAFRSACDAMPSNE